MELWRKFSALNLYGNDDLTAEDYEKRPFLLTAKIVQGFKMSVYGCAFNPFASPLETNQSVATVGGKKIFLFTVPRDKNQLLTEWVCTLPTDKSSSKEQQREENLYSVTWCYDTYEAEQGRNPFKVVSAGALGQIYVIDSVSSRMSNRLRGYGGEINDIRTCPVNPSLVACASADQSVRIHHIRNEVQLVVIGGLHSHSGTILSLDWAPNGEYLLSCGFDHQILKWDLSGEKIKEHLSAACKVLHQERMNILDQKVPVPEGFSTRHFKEDRCTSAEKNNLYRKIQYLNASISIHRKENCIYPIYNPICVSSDLHSDYVDCVRSLPFSDIIASKGCGIESAIHVWRYAAPKGKPQRGGESENDPQTCTTKLFSLRVFKGETWFLKFDVDPRGRWLACGDGIGGVMFYDLNKDGDMDPSYVVNTGNATVRHVTFSVCGRFMITVSDDGTICRFDRVPATVDTKELAKF